MLTASLLPFLGLVAFSHAADCPQASTAEALNSSMSAAEEAFSRRDKEAVLEHAQTTAFDLPCLTEVVEPSLAARLHRTWGLRLFLEHDDQGAKAAFAASRALEPETELAEGIAPAEHPLHQVYAELSLDILKAETLPEPAAGALRLNGEPTLERISALPVVVQVLDEAGAVASTAYIAAGEALPSYEAKPDLTAAAPASVPEDQGLQDAQAPQEQSRSGAGLFAAAGGAAVVAGVFYGLAFKTEKDWNDAYDAGNSDDLDTAYKLNHAFCITSGSAALLAVGLGTGGILVARR